MTEFRAFIREYLAGVFLSWALSLAPKLVFDAIRKALKDQPHDR